MTNFQISELITDLQDSIMGSTLAKCAAADLGIQWAGWALASAFKTEKFYDLAGNVEKTGLYFTSGLLFVAMCRLVFAA